MLNRFAHVSTLLAAIAIPALGWFVADWSGATTLVVYWVETLAICLFTWARVRVQQRQAPRRGHFRYLAPDSDPRGVRPNSFASGFLTVALAFSAAHAVFLGVILFLLAHNGYRGIAEVDWRSVGIGALAVVAFLSIDFLLDLPELKHWSFRRMELAANQGLSRVVVVHLTLILGLAGVAFTDAPDALFGVFVVLKTLLSLGWALPQWEPATPPRWLSRVMNRVPNVHPGKRFEEFWEQDQAAEVRRRERNEESLPEHRTR